MPVRISDAELLADLKMVAKRLGKQTVKYAEHTQHGRFGANTLLRRFGDWNSALTKAGLQTRHLSDADLLEDLRRVARKLGRRVVTRSEYQRLGASSITAINNHFGSWGRALKRASLRRSVPLMYSRTKILMDLRRIAGRLERRVLTFATYRENGGAYSSSVIRKRFGRWSTAVIAAKLELAAARCISDADLLRDLRRVAKTFRGTTVTQDEYDAQGMYCSASIVHRFGSWAAALVKARLQPSWQQVVRSSTGLRPSLRALASIPGLTAKDRVAVAKTLDRARGLDDEVILQILNRMNLGPMELPSGTPNGASFWKRCIAALQKVQPDPKKLAPTNVLQKLGRQLHRAVAVEVLGREPLSPAEERRVAQELRQRKAA